MNTRNKPRYKKPVLDVNGVERWLYYLVTRSRAYLLTCLRAYLLTYLPTYLSHENSEMLH